MNARIASEEIVKEFLNPHPNLDRILALSGIVEKEGRNVTTKEDACRKN